MTIPNLRPAIKRVFDRMTRAKPQKIIPRSDESPPAAASLKPDLARVEGWDIFDCGLRDDGLPRVEIQRLDSPEAGAPPSRRIVRPGTRLWLGYAQDRPCTSRRCNWSIRPSAS